MSFKALDHSSTPPDPAGFARAAKAAGFDAVMRYLPLLPGTLTGDRVGRLTLDELAACHAAGLGVGIIYERDTASYHRPLGGAAAGQEDGLAARAAATALGFAPGFPIFGAADFDPTPDQYPTVRAYFEAGGFDPYGDGPLLTYLSAFGFAHFWLMNWGGAAFSDPHLHQQGGQITIAGINCDLNDGYYEDCIWWPPSSVHIQSVGPAQPASPPTEEEAVSMLVATDPKNGCHALCDRVTGAVYCFNPDWTPGGHYLGGGNRQGWVLGGTNGPVVMFEFFDDKDPNHPDHSAYVMMTQGPDGTPHPFSFPSSGVLAK